MDRCTVAYMTRSDVAAPPTTPAAPPAPITWRRDHGGYFASDNDRVHIEKTCSTAVQPWLLFTEHGIYDYWTLREAKAAYAEKRAAEAQLGYWPADPRQQETDLTDVTPGIFVRTPVVYRNGTDRPDTRDERPVFPLAGGCLVCIAPEPVELDGLPGQWWALTCRARNGDTWTSYVSTARPVVKLPDGRRIVDGIDLTPPPDPDAINPATTRPHRFDNAPRAAHGGVKHIDEYGQPLDSVPFGHKHRMGPQHCARCWELAQGDAPREDYAYGRRRTRRY